MKKNNSIVAFTTYAKTTSHFGEKLGVTDLHRGTQFYINGDTLIKELKSADDYFSTEKLTMTQLAEKFSQVGHLPFTVTFKKKEGEVRTLRGMMVSPENILARAQVIDFDVDKDETKSYDNRQRQVDYRTIQSLIVDGVKYELKK